MCIRRQLSWRNPQIEAKTTFSVYWAACCHPAMFRMRVSSQTTTAVRLRMDRSPPPSLPANLELENLINRSLCSPRQGGAPSRHGGR